MDNIRRLVVSTEEAREMIQRYREAEMAVLEGKSVTFNGQQLTLESLSQSAPDVRSGNAGLPRW